MNAAPERSGNYGETGSFVTPRENWIVDFHDVSEHYQVLCL